ncbi:protein DEHYDRATION-INDUCED 19 homolog 5-like isoform X2 [Alnus glutinosa]|uniref:protein DEHYDRATION-INDUCED 19 homolog 5-like isoform X2 n=1 Tax=Alnus glutinosa TaxID=3517 RepID=UPI002D79FFA1|nr:protein DEHYDRATION-INDUCED 19 homolog 5-like isoform X2 [Alnus glutinosa]
MDVDFMAYKVHPSKRFSTVQAARIHTADSHLIFDDSDGEDDARACFPCPFCYVDIDLPMLCNHLQEDHCFDLKNAVCPLCAANLGKDVSGHFIVQHASSLKRRKKSGKSGLTGNSAMLGKRFPANAVGNKHESAPDPLLSLFINNMQFLDPKCIQQDESFRDDASDTSAVKSMEPSSLDEGHEQDNEERRQKAAFVQQLIMSTIF